MFDRYRAKIEQYCKDVGIEVPIGFQRHTPGRYVAIDLESNPPKLVAATWSHEKDAVSYLDKLAVGQKTRMLDFKERRELTLNGKGSLLPGESF